MIERLRKLNPDIEIYSIHDEVFKRYGRVLNIDVGDIVSRFQKIDMPKMGSEYRLSEKSLEESGNADEIRELTAGGCDVQIGVCMGYNNQMNAMEFHKSSEINIAATPLVLLLGLEYEMDKNEYSSDKVKAFYLEENDAVEVYATTLHFCPCQVLKSGFRCVVALTKDTNAPLDYRSKDRLLFKKNKWLICHDENEALINKGVYPGIHGKNYEIKY